MNDKLLTAEELAEYREMKPLTHVIIKYHDLTLGEVGMDCVAKLQTPLYAHPPKEK